VKDVERQKGRELFGSEAEPSALASKIMGTKSRTFDVGAAPTNGRAAPAEKSMRVKLTESERKRVEKMIREAKSLQEIARLEKELNDGRIPAGAADGDRMVT
jgi:U2 small nuclear ribonucleoprotein A'